MGFNNIPNIEDAQFYVDLAFRRAKQTAQRQRTSLREEKTEKSRQIEAAKVGTVQDILHSRLDKIVSKFPSLGQLTPFYNQLVSLYMDVDELKQALGHVHSTAKRIQSMGNDYKRKILDADKVHVMNEARRAFYGRVGSLMEDIDDDLAVLLEARKQFIEFPVVKQMPTIAITGFPNVGKTTLLRDLTGSAPEIKPYSFTTKRLNFGYVEIDEEKIQVIDTPGTLARENKMNTIERMSYVAMRTAADLLVYVWDPTVQYTIELQKRLFDKIRDYDTEIVHYVSKSDLVDDAKEKFAFVDAVDTVDELKEVIQSSL